MKVTGCNTLQYLLQTFVYLFAPICANVRETDFDANMRLVNGRKIWAAMWEYRHPDVDSFTAQVDRVVSWRLDMGMKMMSVIVTWMCALVGDSVCNSTHGTNWLVSRSSWTFTFYWSFTIITLHYAILLQVKPKLTQVRDISKKGNKDAADDVGIFMGDGE